MELPALRLLHQRMRQESVDRTTFSYRNNRARLDVVFLVDENPYVLLIGARSEAPYSFELPVLPGYRVPLLFNERLKPLMDALGVRPNPDSPFRTSLFLKDLNEHIPDFVNARDLPTDMLSRRIAASNVEEADKIYFVGWIAHNDGRNVSPKNLDKTRRILGAATADRCQRSNVSTRWSAVAADRSAIGPVPDPR
ncbi:rloe protein [Leucobacter insecticola]|uniref:Rloe protein n=1 Tax=Leucobacter insecticola TaxID=2714934 RepID=A0A6G8FIA8_9MICO|nr:DUF6037 family protein [Leucobacter insecticola]QIM16033.1 rloe protein [Leucobacter insecticola]